MVDRVDTVLKQELNIPDGLADPSVFVLDPCCGTGSYLVEVLKRIHQTLKSKGEDALIADDLKQAALKRVFGFEILPAPFVVSHMQLGFLLQNLGAPLSETSNEHAGVYLTNALTGWEPLDPEKEKAFQGMLIGFPQLLEEQIGASKVKQQVPILVILGNPPYDAFAGVATTKEERQFIAPYKKGLREKWGIKKYNLDELYIRFFRMAEHRIAEQTGKGIVCFISNFSYLSDPSYVVMRERFLDEFDCLWIDNMNGSSRETGKRTPDGKPDPSVFSTQYNKAGIKLGTAVALLVRKLEKEENAILRYRQFWGKNKRNDLLNSLDVSDIDSDYQLWKPGEQNRYSFRPSDVSGDYQSWPKLIDIFEQMLVGLEECRGGALIDIDKNQLEFRMKKYFDKNTDWDSLKNLKTGLTEDAVGFNAKNVRNKTVLTEEFNLQNIVSYMARPFDKRWCYYSTHSTLWNRPRPRLYAQCVHNNKFLISRMNTAATPEGMPIFVSNTIYDKQAINRNPGAFPLFLYGEDLKARKKPKEQIHLITTDANVPPKANLSQAAREYLLSMKIDNPDLNIHNGSLLWMHVLAIVCSRAYLDENADGIRNNWPSVPLPKQKELLESSAIIGEKLASLMDTQTSIIGITTSPISPGIQNIGVITRCDGSQLLPKELEVTVGWGHAVNGGIVMPGKGKVVERDYTMAEEQPTAEIATKFDVLPEKIFELLGKRTFDIYLNEVAYWKNIPAKVWEYTIGGYQVMKKWLSYREATLLGRPLSTDEAREFRDMARRITAIILLQPALDENYQQCKHDVYSWKILDV
jgi:predicted helicase